MTDTLRTIALVIAHTPVWVWCLYAALLLLGLQRSRDSIAPLWRVLVLPVAMTMLAISSGIGAGLGTFSATLLGLAAGTVAGWLVEGRRASRRLLGGKVWLRGEWMTLVQIVAVLIARYVTNVVSATNPILSANPLWHLGAVFVCSLLSGVFLGRAVATWASPTVAGIADTGRLVRLDARSFGPSS